MLNYCKLTKKPIVLIQIIVRLIDPYKGDFVFPENLKSFSILSMLDNCSGWPIELLRYMVGLNKEKVEYISGLHLHYSKLLLYSNKTHLNTTNGKQDNKDLNKPVWHQLVEHDQETWCNHDKQNGRSCVNVHHATWPRRFGVQVFIRSVLARRILLLRLRKLLPRYQSIVMKKSFLRVSSVNVYKLMMTFNILSCSMAASRAVHADQ